MPKQMWFGSEQRMQWVPAPSSGMQETHVGYRDSMDYQNGKVGISRSMQTHKEYAMDFPVQEAAGLEGLDVFNKFACGFYGDTDSYPFFFANPMHYDQNLLPPNFAMPGLYRRGWSSISSDDAKSYYNLATNPSVELTATNYSGTAGTSGVQTVARTNAGSSAYSGQYVYRVTWTTGTSAVSGGLNYLDTPVTALGVYGFSAQIKCSKIQRLQMTINFRNGADVSVGTSVGTATVVAASTWTNFIVTGATAPATTVTADIEIRAVAGTSGTNWAIGNTLEIDGVMIYQSTSTPTTYFDGDTSGASWTGAAHASASFMYIARSVPSITTTPANVYNLPPIQATFNVTSSVGAVPTPTNTYGNIPYALIPIPPGYTLWLGACGSATGTAQVVVYLFNTPADVLTPVASSALTLLSSSASTRLNASFSGSTYQYAKIFIRRTSTVASTITLSSMMAQLWPTGVTPTLTGNFIEGKGHRGLKFSDDAGVYTHVQYDPYRNVTVHYKGLSTTLVEAQDRG